jgi:hypothetical protein
VITVFIDWGDMPTWLAFIAARFAAVFTWRTLRRERLRDEAREAQEHQQQVAAWFERTPDDRSGLLTKAGPLATMALIKPSLPACNKLMPMITKAQKPVVLHIVSVLS